MSLDLLHLAVLAIASLTAGTLAAVTGFGGAVILLPVLVWAFGVREAIPILTVAQLVGNLSRVWFNHRELDLPVVGRFALGAVPTSMIGGVLFATAPAGVLVRLLGLFLLVMVGYRHTRWGRNTTMTLSRFSVLGAAAGGVSATVGTVGPFMAPFFLYYGLVKGAYIGTEALSTVVMHVVKLAVYGGYALLTPVGTVEGLGIGAFLFLGSYLGTRILRLVPTHVFPYIIEGVMVVAGLTFLVGG